MRSVERDGKYVGPRCVAGKIEPITLGDNKHNWVHGGQPKLFAAVYSQFHYFTSSSCFHPVHDALSFIHAQAMSDTIQHGRLRQNLISYQYKTACCDAILVYQDQERSKTWDTISTKLFTATLKSIFRRLNWEGGKYQRGGIEKDEDRQKNSETIQDQEITISRTSDKT